MLTCGFSYLVGRGDGRLPQPIRMPGVALMHLRLGAVPLHGFRAQPGRLHQARNAAAVHRPASGPQRLVNPRATVPRSVVMKATGDLPVRTRCCFAWALSARPTQAWKPPGVTWQR